MANNNTQLIYTQWNVDSNGNKISIQIQNEVHQIVQGKILLNQLPDEFYRLQINGYVEIKKNQTITSANQYSVDYTNGLVYFHNSKEGNTITVTQYYGKGIIFIDASRIVTESQNGTEVVQTLDALTNETNTAKDNTITATNNANSAISTINTTNTNMQVWEDYNPTKAYVPLNKVQYNGNSYVNIVACTGVYPTDITKWKIISRHGEDGLASFDKVTVTIGANNTTHVIHNLNYDPVHDTLWVLDSEYGSELEINVDYTENPDNISIDLINGFTLNIGDKLTFKLGKGINDATLQEVVDDSIVKKGELQTVINDSVTKKNDLQTVINTADLVTYGSRGDIQRIDESLAEKAQQAFFLRFLKANPTAIIDLYGDSITEGVGATGHNADGTHQVIYNDYLGTVYYEGDHECGAWANLFRNYLTARFPSVAYTNRGIGGKSAKWCNTNKGILVKTGDVAFIQLGTNDRWDNTLSGFYTDLKSFVEYVKTRYTLVILMSATPAMTDGDVSNNFNSYQMDEVIARVAEELDVFHISNLRDIESWSKKNNLNYTELLQTQSQGSHPIDLGHKYIYENICSKLHLADNTSALSNRLPIDAINASTTFYNLPYGESSCILSDTNVTGLPTSYGGKLITHRYGQGGTDNRHSYQEFIPKLSNARYVRIFNTDNTPTEWFPSTFNVGTNNVADISNLPIGIYANVILDGGSDTPVAGKGGIRLTIKLNSNITFCKPQEIFLMFSENTQYTRTWGTSSWGYWEKNSKSKSEVISGDFGTLAAGEIKTLQLTTANIIDTNYYNIVCSLKSIADSKVMFNFVYNHTNTNMWVTAHNRHTASIAVNTVEFNVSMIKK